MGEKPASKSCKDYDHDQIIANILFDLRKVFNCSATAACFAGEKMTFVKEWHFL